MRAVAVLAGSLALAACAGGPMPAVHYYTLWPPGHVAADDGSPATGEGLVVGVRAFAVDPPYDQDRLVYRSDPETTEVGFYTYHRWVAPLGRLVPVAVADALRGTSGIAVIEPAVAHGEYSASLGGRLLYLEEIDAAAGQQVRIALELVLRGEDGEILWSDTLASASPIDADSGGEVVVALRQTLERMLATARVGIESALD